MVNIGNIISPLIHMAERLNPTPVPWVVCRNTACLLQNIPLKDSPTDLDIYTDGRCLPRPKALNDWSIVTVFTSETKRFSSRLNYCQVGSLEIKLITDLVARTKDGIYKVASMPVGMAAEEGREG